jgi:hypothetical protein
MNLKLTVPFLLLALALTGCETTRSSSSSSYQMPNAGWDASDGGGR